MKVAPLIALDIWTLFGLEAMSSATGEIRIYGTFDAF